ncbi:MAG TPA: serine hydrolase [Pyrinomonadaceae bacterium]|jgi:beta-lactamase class A
MKKLVAALFCLVVFCAFCASGHAQKVDPSSSGQPEFTFPKGYKPAALKNSPALQTLLDSAVNETLEKFKNKNLKAENVAATLIDLRDANNLRTASIRGEEKIYPASVVKMFYMNALEHWLELGQVKLTPELERGLKDMIVVSSNEATQYILDVLTGVSSGAELPEKEFTLWSYKRNIVNRFYINAQGYRNINVNQKTFCEDAYGIEQQFRGYKGNNRNMLTTNATARLLAEIVLGKTNTPERTAVMMNLMKRDFSGESSDPDDQAHGFTGIALNNKGMKDARLWSKAGWTSKTRHDAAYIETPDGLKFVLVVFTENFAAERNIIPSVAEIVLDNLGKIK